LSRGQSFLPTFIQDGSAPRTWSVEPTLPSFLTLDTASGRIFQTKTTQDLPVMSPKQYTMIGHERRRHGAAPRRRSRSRWTSTLLSRLGAVSPGISRRGRGDKVQRPSAHLRGDPPANACLNPYFSRKRVTCIS
jgi:hypothetical protein